MTRTKQDGECPICGKVLTFIAKHMRELHSLKNQKQRAILNGLATCRTLVPAGPCPVPLPGCPPHILNLVKHLHSKHVELKKDRMDREIQALKRAAAISKLAALWATEPDPPMVSVLDLPDNQAQQNDPEAGIILCQKRTCVNARLRVRQLEQELADVRTVSENTQQLCILSMINLFQ